MIFIINIYLRILRRFLTGGNIDTYKNIEKHKVEQEQLQRQAALISELQCGLAQEQTKADNLIKEKLNEQAQFFSSN